MYTALTTNIICRLEARQALIYKLVLGLTGENGKYNYSKAVHIYPPFSDIPCSAKYYKIAPALTASMLYFNGVDDVSISKRLGHAQVSTTANIYAHVMEEADQRNADILADVFLKKA